MTLPSDLFVEPSYILSIPHTPTVEHCIIALSLRFALLGRIDAARDFLALFYSRPVLQNLESSGPRALTSYWHATSYPANIPAFMKTEDYFKEYVTSKEQEDTQWPAYVPQDKRTEDNASIAAILAPEHNGRGYLTTLVPKVALEIAIKLAEESGDDPTSDVQVIEILNDIVRRFSADYAWRDIDLIDSPRCSPLFMSGALAKSFNVTDQELDSRAAELLDACRQRYWHGLSSDLPETIPELLQICNDVSVDRFNDHSFEMDQEVPTSLYKPPATEEDLSSLETRLNITLPEDFKAFLRVSNGFGGIWNGYFPGPPLHSTNEVDWLEYGEYELMFIQMTLPNHVTFAKNSKTGIEELLEPQVFNRVICIASEDTENVWLVPPPMMQKMRDHYNKLYAMVDDDGKRTIERAVDDFAGSWEEWEQLEWGCVYWSSGGSAQLDSFKSFQAWLANSAYDAKTVKSAGGFKKVGLV